MRALIADDSVLVRRILCSVLQGALDFEEIVQEGDGEAAIEALLERDFDLVLLDWNMPGKDGIDVLSEFRAAGKDTPVLMVTSESDKAHVVKAFDAGASGYLIKPFKNDVVAEKIKEIMGRLSV
jgi:two-component system, chemotaxis family, chemotaxis protein CheY